MKINTESLPLSVAPKLTAECVRVMHVKNRKKKAQCFVNSGLNAHSVLHVKMELDKLVINCHVPG